MKNVRRVDDDSLGDVLGALYDAAAGKEDWSAVLRRLTQMAGSRSASLIVGEGASYVDHVQYGNDPEYWEGYRRELFSHDFRMKGLKAAKPATVMCDADPRTIPPGSDTRPVYDFLRRYDLGHGMGVLLDRDGERWTMATFIHNARSEGPDREAVRLFEMLTPHLRRAMDLQLRLGHLGQKYQATTEVLEHSPYGITIVDGLGKVVWMNERARQAVRAADAVTMERGVLVCRQNGETRKLHATIADAGHASMGGTAAPSGPQLLGRPGMAPLALSVLPLPGGGAPFEHAGLSLPSPRVGVFMSDPSRARAPSARLLTRLYKLQPAQARLAVALAEGHSVDEYAREAGVTVKTARERLKQVLRQTGTHRQGELVHLVLGLPPETRH